MRFDGERLFDGSWLFDQELDGIELHELAMGFAFSTQESVNVDRLSMSLMPFINRVFFYCERFSMGCLIENKSIVGSSAVRFEAQVQHNISISGELTRDSMWTFDGSVPFDGSRRFNAAIIKEAI